MFGSSKSDVEKAVEGSVRRLADELIAKARKDLDGIVTVSQLRDRIDKLREELETAKIEKARKDEDFARREREIEHKVGLERKRQEFEVDSAKRETMVKVREENLTADKTRFAEEMKFQRERFSEEVGYLKGLMEKVLERLPSAEIAVNLSRESSAPTPKRERS